MLNIYTCNNAYTDVFQTDKKDVERLSFGFEEYSNDDARSPFLQSHDICHVVARHMSYDWMIYVVRLYDGCHGIYEKAFLHHEIQVLTLRHCIFRQQH